MTPTTISELMARVSALEAAIAYTATAYASVNPSAKSAIVEALKFDANNQREPQIGKAMADLAGLIEAFKITE